MRVKTSVTLSGSTLRRLTHAVRPGESLSETIERLLRERLAAMASADAVARELLVLNRHAEALNQEAQDVLDYQGDM